MTSRQSFVLKVAVIVLSLSAGVATSSCNRDDEYLWQEWNEPQKPLPNPDNNVDDWDEGENGNLDGKE